jgi:hypothetical protein
MLQHLLKFLFQLLGWRDMEQETKDVLKKSVQTHDSLLIVYPSSSSWDLLLIYAFLSTSVAECNWWLFREKLPRWFCKVLPNKRKILDSTATAISFSHQNFCDIYLVPEDLITVEEIPQIAASVAVVGANYHPDVRRVHISAQSKKYDTSVDYLPYYLSQFLRLNPGDLHVMTPTYLKKKGITYKPCLTGKLILTAFDPLALGYLAHVLLAALMFPVLGWTAILSFSCHLFLLHSKSHQLQIFLQALVLVRICLSIIMSDHPLAWLVSLSLSYQSFIMTRAHTHFNWTVSNTRRRLVASYGLALNCMFYWLLQ